MGWLASKGFPKYILRLPICSGRGHGRSTKKTDPKQEKNTNKTKHTNKTRNKQQHHKRNARNLQTASTRMLHPNQKTPRKKTQKQKNVKSRSRKSHAKHKSDKAASVTINYQSKN